MSTKIFYDLHTHILPGMDDGCKNTSESLAVLKSEFAQGAAGIAATSHYYPKESISDFLDRRRISWEMLKDELAAEMPDAVQRIKLGAEVYYHRGLATDPDLPKLCLGKSNYLLLEMPFKQWSSTVLRDVEMILNTRGLNVIIAHLERFLKLTDKSTMRALLDMNVIVQVNTGNYLRFGTKRKALKMLSDGTVQLLSSDTHNSSERPPNFGAAIDAIKKAKLEDELTQVLAVGEHIFNVS